MARERLSSLATYPTKFVGPIFSVLLVMVYILLVWKDHAHFSSIQILLFPLVLLMGYCGVVMQTHLKQVDLEGNKLYISNYKEEIIVPINMIEKVFGGSGNPTNVGQGNVIIRFKEESKFGTDIIFMPKWRYLFFYQHHPVVDRLNKMIEEENMDFLMHGSKKL